VLRCLPVGGNTTIFCDACPLQHLTYGYLPSLHWYQINTAWWQKHMCVSNCPRLYPKAWQWGVKPRDLLTASPALHCYTNELHYSGHDLLLSWRYTLPQIMVTVSIHKLPNLHNILTKKYNEITHIWLITNYWCSNTIQLWLQPLHYLELWFHTLVVQFSLILFKFSLQTLHNNKVTNFVINLLRRMGPLLSTRLPLYIEQNNVSLSLSPF